MLIEPASSVNVETSVNVESGDDLYQDNLMVQFRSWFKDDVVHAIRWRKHAIEDYRFYSGHQWDSDDISRLEQQNRFPIVMNQIAPMVNAVIGSEINNRRVVRYIPRELGDSVANELLTGVGEWFRQEAGAEDEETYAFKDNVICGMGWTDTRLDYIRDPAGFPVVERLNPLKMVWDCRATKPNLTDATRLWYVDDKPLKIVREMFPNTALSKLSAYWARDDVDPLAEEDLYDQTRARFYLPQEKPINPRLMDETLIRIVELRYYEMETYYRVFNSATGSFIDLSEKEKKDKVVEADYIEMKKKIAKRVFLGGEILGFDPIDVPPNSLGWEAMTGYYDQVKNRFYGVVKPAKDPQKWSNKYFSQVSFLLNAQSKGGILAERGAFEDDREAEESFNSAEAITYVNEGRMGGIVPKPIPQFPQGFFQLFSTTTDAITRVTGLSPEFIGTREVNQPGVLESQRRQSTLNLLAELFNSLKNYRKRQGEIVLYLIQNRLSDGRIVRILGENGMKGVPLMRENLANSKYDIIIDDAPTSPNEKERTFSILQQMLPMLQQFLTPEIALKILKYSPIPATLVNEISAQRQQQQQMEEIQPDPRQQEMMAKTQLFQIDAQRKALDLQMKQYRSQIEAELAYEKAQIERERLALEAEKIRIQALKAIYGRK